MVGEQEEKIHLEDGIYSKNTMWVHLIQKKQ